MSVICRKLVNIHRVKVTTVSLNESITRLANVYNPNLNPRFCLFDEVVQIAVNL